VQDVNQHSEADPDGSRQPIRNSVAAHCEKNDIAENSDGLTIHRIPSRPIAAELATQEQRKLTQLVGAESSFSTERAMQLLRSELQPPSG
jgi:hypothetical protein